MCIDLSRAVFAWEPAAGEGAENGIASSKEGAVILTNQNCYLFRAENGVKQVWATPKWAHYRTVIYNNNNFSGGKI